MDSTLVQTVIGLVLAYSLLSVIVTGTNELFRIILSRGLGLENLGRSGFLRQGLESFLGAAAKDPFAERVLKHPLVGVLDAAGKLKKNTDYVDAKHLTTAIIQSATNGQGSLDGDALPPELKTLIGDVTKDIEEIRQVIRDWIDKQYMDMTKLFKRNQYVWSFFIGLFFALFLNIDTIQMAQVLWKDPTLRAAVVQTAGDVTLPESDAEPDTNGTLPDAQANLQNAINDLFDANLPILWREAPRTSSTDDANVPTYEIFPVGRDPGVFDDVTSDNGLLLTKSLGVVMTVLAVSLGADFWFNLLRRLTQRSDTA